MSDTQAPPATRASVRYLRGSAFKIRPVLALIRGKSVTDARDVLRLSERDAAQDVLKVLESAIANAEHNSSIPEDELFVSEAFADEGPTMKRWRPRARGRATRIRKRSSHVTVVLSRYTEEQLARIATSERGTAAERRRRLLRRRGQEAAAAREAASHDHDHGHDHDHDEVADDEAPGDEPTGAADTVALGKDESPEVAAAATGDDEAGPVPTAGEPEQADDEHTGGDAEDDDAEGKA